MTLLPVLFGLTIAMFLGYLEVKRLLIEETDSQSSTRKK